MHRRDALALLLTLAAGCTPPPDPLAGTPKPLDRNQARTRLRELAREYEHLMGEHGRIEWEGYAGKRAESGAADALKALRKREVRVFEEAVELVNSQLSLAPPREVELWRRGKLGLELLGDPESVALADEAQAMINDHRYEVGGKTGGRSLLRELERSNDRRKRQQSRRLLSELHTKVRPTMIELLERRRALAEERQLGSFHAKLLQLRGVDFHALSRHIGGLVHATRRPHGAIAVAIRRRLRRRRPAPWDVAWAVRRIVREPDAKFPAERALDVARRIYGAFGFDLDDPPLDLTVRDFAFGGQAISLRVPDDVRIVISPSPGARFYGTLLHELGHAVAATRTAEANPIYKGYEWIPGLMEPAFAEGLAEVFGRLLDVPSVLTDHLGLSARDAKRVVRARRIRSVLQVRRAAAAITFEKLAHERPEDDLDRASLALERQVAGIHVPRGTGAIWAASPFLATYPAYLQSYLLASMMAVQVRAALVLRFGKRWMSPEAGEHLRKTLMADGARWTSDEKMIRATGAPLRIHEYAVYLNAGVG